MHAKLKTTTALGLALSVLAGAAAQAGPSGSELDLNFMPAAGGMEGVGVARPQDTSSMIFGNPATLTQMKGRAEFLFGGSFISPQLKSRGTFSAPGPGGQLVGVPIGVEGAPGTGKSNLDDLAAPHAAVVQRLSPNFVVGMGLTGLSGLGSDFRRDLPVDLALTADLKLFGAAMTGAYQVSENLSLGASFVLGIGSLQAGTQKSTASSNNFGVGGRFGVNYDAGLIKLGVFYRTELKVKYANTVLTGPDTFSDLTLTQPREIKGGIATTDDFSKRLMLAFDFGWKNYSKAKGYQDFWHNQWKAILGLQYRATEKLTLRTGWSINRKISKKASALAEEGFQLGQVRSLFVPGLPDLGLGPETAPIFPDILQLAQTTIANGLWRQGVSAGLGFELLPGVQLDLYGNMAFDGEGRFISPTGGPQDLRADGKLFSAGMGVTWKFGASER